jgi:hypothetical protein
MVHKIHPKKYAKEITTIAPRTLPITTIDAINKKPSTPFLSITILF